MSIANLDTIKQLIAEKENGRVEFKETTGQLERGMETLCAFLNGEGGGDITYIVIYYQNTLITMAL